MARKAKRKASTLPAPTPINPIGSLPAGGATTNPNDYQSGLITSPIPPILPNTDQFEKEIAKPGAEFGQTGTLIFQGLVTMEDYNPLLNGTQAYDIFDEMRRSDGTVRAALQVCKLPIIATDWRIEPATQEPEDVFIKDFIEDQLFNQISWKRTLRELLLEFDFGFSVNELIYKTVQFEGKTLIGLERLATRKQRTIFAWVTQSNERGVTQIVPAGGTLSIPREKLLVVTHEQEGDNYPGISLLRTAYKHWYLKKGIERVDAIAIERQGTGILQVTTPAQANAEDKVKIREIARNVRANEESYVETPQGYTTEFMDMKAHTLRDPVASLLYHDRQIMKSVLAQFIELGATQSGSKALSADHSELFIQALEAEADNIAEAIENDVIARLVRINFGDNAKIPSLTFSSLGDPKVAIISEAVDKFVRNGTVTTDFEDEQYFRTLMNLPLRDEDEVAVTEFKEKLNNILNAIGAIAQPALPVPPVSGFAPTAPDALDPEQVNSDANTAAEPDMATNAKPETAPTNQIPESMAQGSGKAELLEELRKFVRDAQIEIAKRVADGNPVTKEEVLAMEVQLVEKQAEVEQKAAETKSAMPSAAETKIDQAIKVAAEILGELNDYRPKKKTRSAKNAH